MTGENSKQSGRLVRALHGTHERVVETALRYVTPGARVLDLGAGSGALAERLQAERFRVTAADIKNYFELNTEFVELDFNDPAFDQKLSVEFDLITSVEVIEHLENPTAFLRSICRLLKPNGVAILTTPNVENVPARLKFLLGGRSAGDGQECAGARHAYPFRLVLPADRSAKKRFPVDGAQIPGAVPAHVRAFNKRASAHGRLSFLCVEALSERIGSARSIT